MTAGNYVMLLLVFITVALVSRYWYKTRINKS